ncbi:hypothetical protein RclHR1_11490002 [Rhizophagus clarus]|uniref:Uncharacterized protein n=1 Tax=Rhizophagus clarus TaxID=94130 RepID=A0A2Z6Q8S4_9GLOM|nr:hypothetical protein RclHR1_11490002 [Rhizophagus clarus]GES96481.1 hypothetical protein RCL_jg14509.t1 [Rhizophagus clarus]
MFYEVAPFAEPINHDDNSEEYVVKSILDTEFEDYVSGFLLIKTSIEIEVGTSFHSMEIAVHFIERYTLQNNCLKVKNFQMVLVEKGYFTETRCFKLSCHVSDPYSSSC